MTAIYCRRHHDTEPTGSALCGECTELLAYAMRRLDRCPKGNGKSSCRKCDIHCYDTAHRQRIRRVMRYVGPRMILIHPVEALRHLWSEMR